MRQSVDALEADLAAAGPAGERYRAHALYLQGRVRAREGQSAAEVLPLFEQAARRFEQDEPNSALRLFNLTTLVVALSGVGRDADALRYADQAVVLAATQHEQPANLADAFSIRGRLKLELADHPGALADLQAAHARYLTLNGPASFVTVQNEALLARAMVASGELQAGLARAREAVAAMERVRPDSHSLAQVAEWQGLALLSAQRFADAEAAFQRALAIRRDALKQPPRALAGLWLRLAEASRRAGDSAAAARHLAAAEAARGAQPFAAQLERSYEREKAAAARP
jgi:tetratricopeptide (TPR) repeat protein